MVIFHGYKSIASCHPQVESVNRGPKHQSHVLEEMEDVGAPATCQSPTYAHPESTHRNFVKRSTHTHKYIIIYNIYIYNYIYIYKLTPPKTSANKHPLAINHGWKIPHFSSLLRPRRQPPPCRNTTTSEENPTGCQLGCLWGAISGYISERVRICHFLLYPYP